MTIFGDALLQAFMPKHEYECLREEEKAWSRLQRPLVTVIVAILCIAVFVSSFISLRIVFPGYDGNRPFCPRHERRIDELAPNASGYSESWNFYLTEEGVAGIYLVVVFIPSAIVFLASAVFLFAESCHGGRLFSSANVSAREGACDWWRKKWSMLPIQKVGAPLRDLWLILDV